MSPDCSRLGYSLCDAATLGTPVRLGIRAEMVRKICKIKLLVSVPDAVQLLRLALRGFILAGYRVFLYYSLY